MGHPFFFVCAPANRGPPLASSMERMGYNKKQWRYLIPGTIAIAAVIASAFAVLFFARIGSVSGSKVTLYSVTSSARGVMRGTDVWLAGRKVGTVKNIRFRPIEQADSGARLVLELEVQEDRLELFRRDSYAQIRAGGRLIAAPVIYVTTGTPAATALRPGDTLTTRPQDDSEGMASQIAIASRQFPEIISNVKMLNVQLTTARGTVGAMMGDNGVKQLEVVRDNASRLTTRALHGRGSVGLVMRNGDVMVRARQAMASADSLRLLLASNTTSVGRFRRDSTLLRSIGDVRNEVSIAKYLLTQPRGTAGRVLADSAIVRELTRLQVQLADIMADVKARPIRYIAF
jgi:hypothetical protein